MTTAIDLAQTPVETLVGRAPGRSDLPSYGALVSAYFGGEHLQDLYITSAKVGLSEKQLDEQPLAGGLFVLKKCGQGVATAVFECQ